MKIFTTWFMATLCQCVGIFSLMFTMQYGWLFIPGVFFAGGPLYMFYYKFFKDKLK